jgi:hypothetical protein
VKAVRPKTSVASSGRTVRSWPIIPPTRPLTPTRSANWPAFSRRPRVGSDTVVIARVWAGDLPAEVGESAQDDGRRDRAPDDFGGSDGPRDRPERGACGRDLDVSDGIRPDPSTASGA